MTTTVSDLSQYEKDKEKANELYKKTFGKNINWENPQTYNEKIHVFKISDEAEELWRYADKYEVRKYIEKTVGPQYLIPLYGVWSKVDDIDLTALPDTFVLKATHGSGWNIICNDKSTLDWEKAKVKLSSWMLRNYYNSGQERQYKKAVPRIICEKLLTPSGANLRDYKIFCFAGKPHVVEVVKDRFTNLARYFYDPSWKRVPIKTDAPKVEGDLQRPPELEEMLKVATKLSAPFKHVRVDLYDVHGKIYFGELTFTTANGTYVLDPPEYDKIFGDLFKL